MTNGSSKIIKPLVSPGYTIDASNSHGDFAGHFSDATGNHEFAYYDGSMHFFNTTEQENIIAIKFIEEDGEVVGYAEGASGSSQIFIYYRGNISYFNIPDDGIVDDGGSDLWIIPHGVIVHIPLVQAAA